MRLIILTLLLLAPFSLFAQEFTPLVGIPGVDPGNADIGTYVQAIYMLAITVAAFLAVVKIIFGGVQYLLSDVVTTKEDAKKDIRGALVGLLIVLTAVLILNTINKDLTKLDLFSLDNALQFRPSGQGFNIFGSGLNVGAGGATDGGPSSCTAEETYICGGGSCSCQNFGSGGAGGAGGTYTLNTPDFPEDDGKSVKLLSPFNNVGSVIITDTTGAVLDVSDVISGYVVEYADGTTERMPCGFLTPSPPGC